MTKPTTWIPEAEQALRRLNGRLFASTTEAALILRYDPRTLRKSIEAGDVPAVRVGVTYRVPVAWLRAQAGLGTDGSEGAA
jgi:excisionase family DNA binding protein